MIKWFKREHKDGQVKQQLENDTNQAQAEAPQKPGVFSRIKQGLSQTRQHFGDSIGRLLLGKKEIDDELLEEIETILLRADLGIATTNSVITAIKDNLSRKKLADGNAVYSVLRQQLQQILSANAAPLLPKTTNNSPFVILVVGINGAGKTTTIGKLAKKYQEEGKTVMLAAGDTFRAAAVEQLQIWGERNQIPVVAQHTGADSASVVFDALQSAKSRGIDVLIADTAGRLHTQSNLMDELKKVKKVMKKIDSVAPHETLLVLDASIGQNALNQAREFNQAIGLSGIAMTKLDGTAKGGILFAIANELGIPFRYVGIGEGIDDLRVFDAAQFVSAIFNDDSTQKS